MVNLLLLFLFSNLTESKITITENEIKRLTKHLKEQKSELKSIETNVYRSITEEVIGLFESFDNENTEEKERFLNELANVVKKKRFVKLKKR